MRKNWGKHNLNLRRFEKRLYPKKCKMVAGLDESGRGPLAGPVVACAVILRNYAFRSKIYDSKKLSFAQRHEAFTEIIKNARVGLGIIDREVIDKKNILQATIMAMRMALDDLGIRPDYLLVDGKFKRSSFPYPSKSVVKGDSLCFSIACASIVAKVVRDNLMFYYSMHYPQYSFHQNRGYYSKEHISAVKRYGLSPIHRRSFRPINRTN